MGGSTSGEKEKKKKGSFMGAGTRGEKEIKLKGGLLCWKKKERQIWVCMWAERDKTIKKIKG